MKVDIDRFGLKDVQVDPETLFSFPQGLAGFEGCKRFKLFHEEGGGTVFWLQCVDDSAVSFPIVAAERFDIVYEIELSDEECALLELTDPNDIAIVLVVYKNEADGGKIAANSCSPVILNMKARRGMQKILHEIHPTLICRAK